MATVSSFISILAIGYLLSSIPTANIMMRLFKKQDLQKLGTGNITSTALILHTGKLPSALSPVRYCRPCSVSLKLAFWSASYGLTMNAVKLKC